MNAIRRVLEPHLINAWYQGNPLLYALSPFSQFYKLIIGLRRKCYETGIFKTSKLPVPVIVVGNITIGGTGKTPLVCWVVEYLKHNGYKPGVVSKGYGRIDNQIRAVDVLSSPDLVGDEPLLISKRCNCPVVVGNNRAQAAYQLVRQYKVDVVVSDDGLSHYGLNRDIEIVVFDASRKEGNGYCLPQGPLREPLSRLKEADFVVMNGSINPSSTDYQMRLQPSVNILPVSLDGVTLPGNIYQGQAVYGVCGIGNPARFFQTLRSFGMIVHEKPFPDHHNYTREDFEQMQDLPIMMTEKDALKCRGFAKKSWGFIPVKAVMDLQFGPHLLAKLEPIAKTCQLERERQLKYIQEQKQKQRAKLQAEPVSRKITPPIDNSDLDKLSIDDDIKRGFNG